ncbi:nuclease-related domain-containing protein [Ornithinibacillus bavariensis]|uniref:nuclease-related domain-containing protein n=1 Tax=Ornithinibacillus bavariensis TaxID=545502 RepID=UPI000EDD2505|nr:nuclease [Ornithinibacillus sp.]
MEVKKRTPSRELQILNSLSYRSILSEKENFHYLNLKKGYEGELLFDRIVDQHLHSECLIIKDLLLTVYNTTFQIDTLIIFPNTIELFEIKNYEGEYTYDKDKFYKNADYKITNPEHQIERAETLLRQLLKSHGFSSSINATVVFINPEFTLFNAPTDKPFILPSQINTLLNKLNSNPSKLSAQNKRLAEKLIALHQKTSPRQILPKYNYDQLRKGISCHHCNSFSLVAKGHSCICNKCGERELLSNAIIRSTRELKLLFPDMRVTTSNIFDWCRIIPSKQRIRRILMKHLKLISNGRWSYFE